MMQKISFHAMGCQMLAVIDSPLPAAQAQLDQVPDWFETWEQHLSRFRPDSELSQINLGSGEQLISTVLARVIRAGLLAERQSNGLVSPLMLNALEAAGYDRNFADLPVEISAPVDPPIWNTNWNLQLDFDNHTLILPPGARLDLGGIAKGWAADRAAQRLGKLAPALVDASGDIAASAPQADGSPWPVGVADPLDPEAQLDLVMLWRGGVATSGRDYRRWRKDGRWQHHIIDPRTGLPAQTDVLSVTVVAPSACMAETAAKTALILGSLDGLRWLDDRPELAGLIVLDDGSTIPSRKWLDNVWR
jgi:thiamine biosynthesis lipoprotein